MALFNLLFVVALGFAIAEVRCWTGSRFLVKTFIVPLITTARDGLAWLILEGVASTFAERAWLIAFEFTFLIAIVGETRLIASAIIASEVVPPLTRLTIELIVTAIIRIALLIVRTRATIALTTILATVAIGRTPTFRAVATLVTVVAIRRTSTLGAATVRTAVLGATSVRTTFVRSALRSIAIRTVVAIRRTSTLSTIAIGWAITLDVISMRAIIVGTITIRAVIGGILGIAAVALAVPGRLAVGCAWTIIVMLSLGSRFPGAIYGFTIEARSCRA
jgi:hypothetical protein